jgi:hypothetical protein
VLMSLHRLLKYKVKKHKASHERLTLRETLRFHSWRWKG